MQIEQVIGSVDGNISAQAIQLRLRSNGQSQIGSGRLVAYDAGGLNPIILLDPTTAVSNSTAGSSVLFTSTAFNLLMNAVPSYLPDFTLANTIPPSYFSGGRIVWDNGSTMIEWSLAFGAYTGSNTGVGTNTTGGTGNFGSPTSALPTTGRQAIRTTLASGALSTGNSADYAIISSPTVKNNAGNTFTVVPEPGAAALLAAGGMTGVAFLRRRR